MYRICEFGAVCGSFEVCDPKRTCSSEGRRSQVYSSQPEWSRQGGATEEQVSLPQPAEPSATPQPSPEPDLASDHMFLHHRPKDYFAEVIVKRSIIWSTCIGFLFVA